MAKLSQIDIDFNEIKELLSEEREAVFKSFDVEEDDIVRSTSDALIVLDSLEQIYKRIVPLLQKYPSLEAFFTNDFERPLIFFSRSSIIETIFLEAFIFPELELFEFEVEGCINGLALSDAVSDILKWADENEKRHEDTKAKIKNSLTLDDRESKLSCRCVSCLADFRTKQRELLFDKARAKIDGIINYINENINSDISLISDEYRAFKRDLDKIIHGARKYFRRATINRLEAQIKSILKSEIYFPSQLAKSYQHKLDKLLLEILKKENLKKDIVAPAELERFYVQLSSNFYRSKSHLEREFKKLIKSSLLLKRKDISATILREYLGEFWLHSNARRLNRKIIYHMGPTNSGKTYHAINALCESKKGCYLAPLRLLAGELYDTMNSRGVPTNLLTGEEVVEVDGATHSSSTIEMAKFTETFECAVIDEIQMMTDSQRGWAWTRALVNIAAPEVHVCGDPSVFDLVKNITELCGDTLEVRHYERMCDLEVEKQTLVLSELRENDALIVFSRRQALKFKNLLEQVGFKVSVVYGMLNPDVRREQARKFDSGETDIIVSTDAIAMGMNLPIKRIVFSTFQKVIKGNQFTIDDSHIKQISGRAGRFNRFPTGYVNCLKRNEDGLDLVRNALNCKLPQQTLTMVGPDLEIFAQVNNALSLNNLPELKLSEFLRLFNTMTFRPPFVCVDLKEMIEVAEMVEDSDKDGNLSNSEVFGFACAPVHLGLMEHIQYFVWILNKYVKALPIKNEEIDSNSNDIDYLETTIKCVELFQWLSRHFNNKNFDFSLHELISNKNEAVEKLNSLLSEKIVKRCSSCGAKLDDTFKFAICEDCFAKRRYPRRDSGKYRGTKRNRVEKPVRGKRVPVRFKKGRKRPVK